MRFQTLALALTSLALLVAPAQAQVGGNLAAGPPVEVGIDITTNAAGAPVLSKSEIRLITGEYYRMHIKSDGKVVWRVEAPDLLQNSHLRILTIAGVEVHLQSLVFRAIEFDAAGEAMFSFTPIKPGTYELYVGKDPRSIGRPIGEAGIRSGEKSAIARIIVQ
jgi:hypothetical protein